MCSQLRSPQRPSLQALQFTPQAQPTSRQSPSSADQVPRQNQVLVFCTQLPKLQTQFPSPTGGHHFQFLCPLAPQFLTPQLPSSYSRCISAPQLPNTLLLAISHFSPHPIPAGRARSRGKWDRHGQLGALLSYGSCSSGIFHPRNS